MNVGVVAKTSGKKMNVKGKLDANGTPFCVGASVHHRLLPSVKKIKFMTIERSAGIFQFFSVTLN